MKHLKLLLRSLIKNDACVEGGRSYPWWVAVIFFILATAISVIPTTVSLFTIDAGQAITAAAFESDKGLYFTLQDMVGTGVDITFKNGNTVEGFNDQKDAEGNAVVPYIELTKTGDVDVPTYDPINHTYFNSVISSVQVTEKYTIENADGTKTEATRLVAKEQTIFKFYVFADAEKEALETKLTLILQGRDPFNPNSTPDDSDNALNRNDVSFMLFGKHSFVFYKYNSTKFDGVTTHSPSGTMSGTYRDIVNPSFISILGDTLTKTVENAAQFLREGFNELKLSNAGIQISIYLAINAGIILIMGLVLFLMTRGKNNPYKFYKIHECFKISAWTSFTPAIIALVFGFILGSSNSLGGFSFIIVFGLRSMWLAMKNLRPNPTQK